MPLLERDATEFPPQQPCDGISVTGGRRSMHGDTCYATSYLQFRCLTQSCLL